MLKLFGTLFLISLVAYGSITLLIFFRQDSLLFYPDISGRGLIATPDSIGLDYETVNLETMDHLSVNAWFIPHKQQRAVVLFCHGNAGNISHRLETIKLLHELKLSVLIFDYRGYGNSEGKVSEQGTYLDAEAAWQYLTKIKQYEPDEIILWGRSLGAAIAAHQAAAVDTVKGVVLESTFTSVPDLGKELYPLIPVSLISRYRYNVKQSLTNIHSPVLLMHSRDDEIIPFAHGQRLYELTNPPKTFVTLSGGHNDYVHLSYRQYVEEITKFLDSL